MTPIQALECFEVMQRLHPHLLPLDDHERQEERAPLLCAAMAMLSGMLESTNNIGELIEAARHGESLIDAGICTQEQLALEVGELLTFINNLGAAN